MIHQFVHLSNTNLTTLTDKINSVLNSTDPSHKKWKRDGSIQISTLPDGSIMYHQIVVYSYLSFEEAIISSYEMD